MYYRNAQAALVAYDVTKPSSLTKARHWVAELQRQASPGIVICLVGNKLDLVDEDDSGESSAPAASSSEGDDEQGDESKGANEEEDTGGKRKVKKEEAQAFAEEEGLLFFETSAKTGLNVAEVFAAVANAIPESSLKGRQAGPQRGGAAAGGDQRGGDGGGARVDLGRVTESAKEGCAC